MPTLTDDALNKAIKNGELETVYLLFGEESYLLRNTVAAIVKAAVEPSFASFNLQQFDGETTTFNQIETACEAMPMMAARKCVTVKNLGVDKLSKADLDGLTAMLSNPNPSTVLVLFYTNPKIDVKKGVKFKKLASVIAKSGITCEFALKDSATLKKALIARAKSGGASISPQLCELLIDRCTAQYSILTNEIDKLISYADGNEITESSIYLLTTQTPQSTAFDISNAILQRNFSLAYKTLDKLFYMRVEPVLMMGAINMVFTDLYRLKTAAACSVSAENVIADFKYRSRYRITKLSRDVARVSLEQLRDCIVSLEKADRLLKSSKLENKIILEQMLGEMNLILCQAV